MDQTLEATKTEQVDLYREVHKGLRLALFGFVEAAGSLDGADRDEIETLRRQFADIDMMLQIHHDHEEGDELCALIAKHAASTADDIGAYHERSEEQLAELGALVAELGTGVDNSASVYTAATAFVAGYLGHMQVEEDQVMPELQAAVPADELMEVQTTIRTSVPPPEMCVFLRYMLPAMTPEERTATLAGMKAGAPPEIFEMFWAVAEESLSSSALATIAERIAA